MIVMLNNRDSFVFNLVRYFRELGQSVEVLDSHQTDLKAITDLKPRALVISPGPCTPTEAGISLEAVKSLGEELPILGVCLGHQVIAEAYGWMIQRSQEPMHGRAVQIQHSDKGLFVDLPNPLTIGLYNSLVASPAATASPLQIDAKRENGDVMALSHISAPVFGVQFHPESVLSEAGHALLENFLHLAGLKAST